MAVYNQLSVTLVDHSNEKATTTLRTTGVALDVGNLADVIESMSLSTRQKDETSTVETWAGQPPASESANNELKLLIGYQDLVTFENYVVTIADPDFGEVVIASGTDYVSMAVGNFFIDTFKPAFELAVRSKSGNAVAIRYAKVVGRNV